MTHNAYHFTGDRLRDGRPVPAIGETLIHEGPIEWCHSGLYASRHPFDAMYYARGPMLHRVLCEDIEREDGDKLVCRRRTIVATIDATDLLRRFACKCALDVIHLWNSPAVVRQYLETGDESFREAARVATRITAWDAARGAAWDAAREAACGATRSAAWDAARGAAWDATRSAAWDAARAVARVAEWDATRAAQSERFERMVNDAFNGGKG